MIPSLEDGSQALLRRAGRTDIEMVSRGATPSVGDDGPGRRRDAGDTADEAGGRLDHRAALHALQLTPDRFESKMEYSLDAGKTWVTGNHQVFERRAR